MHGRLRSLLETKQIVSSTLLFVDVLILTASYWLNCIIVGYSLKRDCTFVTLAKMLNYCNSSTSGGKS